MIAATQYGRHAAEDYARLRSPGVREGVRWHLVDRGGDFDFSSLAPIASAVQASGTQVIRTLCHYGWPNGLDIFSRAFVDRFARYCEAATRFLAGFSADVPFYSPINEISFFAFACGDAGWFYPYARGRGNELKRQLVRAAIAGPEAIWSIDPRARIVHVDPIVQVVAPRARPELIPAAASYHASQFDAWDMLAGRLHPELGVHARYLDIIGANFYYNGQWEHTGKRLRWEDTPRDERWTPLSRLLAALHRRYERPLFLAETGHFGVGRAEWLAEVADEVRQALREGVPLEGVCLYPIIDRPDWHHPELWHRSGLWDLVPDGDGRLLRVLIADYAAELKRARLVLP